MIGKLYAFYKTGHFPGIKSDSDSIMTVEDVLLRYDSSLSHEDMKRIVFIDKFLAKILGDPEAPADNYMRTHCLALEVFRKISDAAGFYYPSGRDTGGTCVALTPTTYDKKMKIVSAKLIRITRVRSLGFYDHEVCLEATNVSESRNCV